MPVPKRKRSRARRDSRHADKFITPQSFTKCSSDSCDQALLPHRACPGCGYYKGRKVFETKADRGIKRAQTRKKTKSNSETDESTNN